MPLCSSGKDDGPVLRMAGPSRATLRDLEVNGAKRADGIVVEKCDQPGGRVYLEQLNVDAAQRVGLMVDGVEVANVELHNMNHGGCDLGVKVRGGARLSTSRGRTWSGGDLRRFIQQQPVELRRDRRGTFAGPGHLV